MDVRDGSRIYNLRPRINRIIRKFIKCEALLQLQQFFFPRNYGKIMKFRTHITEQYKEMYVVGIERIEIRFLICYRTHCGNR